MATFLNWFGLDDIRIGDIGEGGNFLLGDGLRLTGTQSGGNDLLIARGKGYNYLSGDAYEMEDYAQGGNDILIGARGAERNRLSGEAEGEMSGPSVGGDDLLIGGADSTNFIYGDATLMQIGRTESGDRGIPVGGNDTLIGGARSLNVMYGDGQEFSSAILGDDVLIGGTNATNRMFGDGYLLFEAGGDDLLRGGERSENTIHGDAEYLFGPGGNDTLIASDRGTNVMYGDGYQILRQSVGGDDVLISGTGDDEMWGEAKFRSGLFLGEETEDVWYANPPTNDETTGGADTFVFLADNGNDTIHDFEPGKDHIELRGIEGIASFDDLTITETDDGSVIDLGSGNTVTVMGIAPLCAEDFIFT